MTEKKDYFSELEKVAEKLLFPYEIRLKNWIRISKKYVDREWKDLSKVSDWIEYFWVFFENQFQAEKWEIENHYIKNDYFNYSSIVVDFWNFWKDFEIEHIKCYGFQDSNKVEKEIVDKNIFYCIIPFFVDSDIFEIYINGNKLEYEKDFFTNPNLGKNNKLLNFIWSFNIEIQNKYILKTKIHPLKNDFQNEIFWFQNKIQEELFWNLEYKSNQDHLWWMSDVIDVIYDARLTLIQEKINKIIRYIFRISDNPQKERKKILLQDFAKQKLDRNFWKNIIKNQKHLEENDKEYENWYFKTKDNELNIKNVKQYWYVDEYNTKLNKFIKSKLYEFILKTKKLWLDIWNKINPYLNYKHFKEVNLNLSEQIPDSLQQHQNYYSLYKELINTYDLDIYWLENKLDIKALDDWFELFCMIRLKEIFSSDKAKKLWFEIIDNNLKNNLFDWDKVKKEDDWTESRVKFRRWEYELHLTFWSCLLKNDNIDVFWSTKKKKEIHLLDDVKITPDFTIEIYKQWIYQWIIILDAKYSLQYYKEYNLLWPKFDLLEELRNKYFIKDSYIVEYINREKFFADKKNNLNILEKSNVQKVILLYPWKVDWNFKVDFKTYEDYNNKLLQTWVWIFPVNNEISSDFEEYFINTIVIILN